MSDFRIRYDFSTRREAAAAVFEYFAVLYNRVRLTLRRAEGLRQNCPQAV